MRKSLTLVLFLVLCLPIWAKGSHSSHHGSTMAHTQSASAPRTSHTTHRTSHYYTNSDGKKVRRPVHSTSAPAGATAQCGDGSYRFSQHARGTCSHHDGVARRLTQ